MNKLALPEFLLEPSEYLEEFNDLSYDNDLFLRVTTEGYKELAKRDPIAAWVFMVRRLCIFKCLSCSVSGYRLTGHEKVSTTMLMISIHTTSLLLYIF